MCNVCICISVNKNVLKICNICKFVILYIFYISCTERKYFISWKIRILEYVYKLTNNYKINLAKVLFW